MVISMTDLEFYTQLLHILFNPLDTLHLEAVQQEATRRLIDAQKDTNIGASSHEPFQGNWEDWQQGLNKHWGGM